ncbi:MAG: aldo/keto reductase [Candidatus Dormiibacterota bacterium]
MNLSATVHLGRSGLRVSRLVLGTMNFGPQTPEPDAFEIMDEAVAAGINCFDTANSYGRDAAGELKGRSEEFIGKWLRSDHGRRDKVVLATKVFASMSELPNDGRLSARHIRSACEASLRRLQTDRIDLYQMHHVDRETPWEEIWDAMSVLVSQGKVIYVGASNFAAWDLAVADSSARANGPARLVSHQPHYSLLSRDVELEVLPACRYLGLGVLPWSPLEGGLLSGILHRQGSGRSSDPGLKGKLAIHRGKIEAFEAFCGLMGHSPGAVALSWLLHQSGVTAPVIGPRTVGQLRDCVKALEVTLSSVDLEGLDAIFPGPKLEAPDAYAT